MNFMAALTQISSADQEVRRTELLTLLRGMNAPFVHYRQQSDAYWPENIVVSFGSGPAEYVIGAHYDSVRGSTGANDNGTGVCVLLALVENFLQTNPQIAVDCVFFDLEELGMIGSCAYLEQHSTNAFRGMINLDICGVGERIVVAPEQHTSDTTLDAALQSLEQSGRHPLNIIERMPPGDNVAFERKEIPTVTLCTLPEEDIESLMDVALCIQLGIPAGIVPSIMETMHNGPRDSVDVIQESPMQAIFDFVTDLVQQLTEKEVTLGRS